MGLRARSLQHFRRKLLDWFSAHRRDLPWRRSRDPYRVWLSEIMLQQTRVVAVLPYYERFLERFANVYALAEAPREEVLRYWSGLGYYSRARNLQRAAQEIVARHGGKFPRSLEDALALPGIGRYTAAAILSIAYGEQLAVLDGNVARVLARLGAVRGELREPRRWKQLQSSADTLLDRGAPGDWNQTLMELGATVCTPRAPMCLLCPAGEFCQARKLGLTESIPERRRRRATVELQLAVAVLVAAHGKTLLILPPSGSEEAELAPLFSRMLQFPAIRVGRVAKTELRRYLVKQFGAARLHGARMEPLATVRHSVTYRSITLTPLLIRVRRLPRLKRGRSVLLDDVANLPVSNLTRKVARVASARLAAG